jgi:hypothetical protein
MDWRGGCRVFVMLLVVGIVLYHSWMDRRPRRARERSAERRTDAYQRAGALDELGRRGDAPQRISKDEAMT